MDSNKIEELLKNQALEKVGQVFSSKTLQLLLSIAEKFKKAGFDPEKALKYFDDNFGTIKNFIPKK